MTTVTPYRSGRCPRREGIRCYRSELDKHPDASAPIVTAARAGDVVLLYSSHDTEHNNAVVLRDYVNEKLAEQ